MQILVAAIVALVRATGTSARLTYSSTHNSPRSTIATLIPSLHNKSRTMKQHPSYSSLTRAEHARYPVLP